MFRHLGDPHLIHCEALEICRNGSNCASVVAILDCNMLLVSEELNPLWLCPS